MRAVLILDVVKEDSSYTEITFEVDFDIGGKHLPSTLTEPEEYPELEVNELSVTAINTKYESLPYLCNKSGISLAEYYQKEAELWFGLTVEQFHTLVEDTCWEFADTLKQCKDAEADNYKENLKEGWD